MKRKTVRKVGSKKMTKRKAVRKVLSDAEKSGLRKAIQGSLIINKRCLHHGFKLPPWELTRKQAKAGAKIIQRSKKRLMKKK